MFKMNCDNFDSNVTVKSLSLSLSYFEILSSAVEKQRAGFGSRAADSDKTTARDACDPSTLITLSMLGAHTPQCEDENHISILSDVYIDYRRISCVFTCVYSEKTSWVHVLSEGSESPVQRRAPAAQQQTDLWTHRAEPEHHFMFAIIYKIYCEYFSFMFVRCS